MMMIGIVMKFLWFFNRIKLSKSKISIRSIMQKQIEYPKFMFCFIFELLCLENAFFLRIFSFQMSCLYFQWITLNFLDISYIKI